MSTLPSTPLLDGKLSHNSNLLQSTTPTSSISKSIYTNQRIPIYTPLLNEYSSISQTTTPLIRRPVSHCTTLPINFLFSNNNNHQSSLIQPLTTAPTISNNFQIEKHPDTSNVNTVNSIKQPPSTTTSDPTIDNHSFEPETERIKSTVWSPKKIEKGPISEMFRCKINQFKKIKATCHMLLLIVFISCISITVSTLRVDSFIANLPKSQERVITNQRHQFEYGFWTMAFITTLFHLMISTTLLVICLIHLYCAYSITKNLTYPDDEVLSYLNSTAVWRNITVYFYLVSLMFSIITNTCFIFVIPTNFSTYSKGIILATGLFLCIFIIFVTLHTLFKWCKIVKEEDKSYDERCNSITCSPVTKKRHEEININSLSTLV